jgi:ATP-binding cassette, subfamily B, heavy metal transporter
MDNKDIKKPLINGKGKEDIDETGDIESHVVPQKKKREHAKKVNNAGATWGTSDTIKDYGIWYTLKFSFPLLLKGDWVVKFQFLVTLLLTLSAKVLSVIHPIVLKFVIDSMTAGESAFYLIILYAAIRLISEANNLTREISFASISASAEVNIASMVYNHIQNQGLKFHLSRETGKIIRICSKGSQSFAQILRYALFVIGPLFLEIILVILSIGFMFTYWFFVLVVICIFLYLLDTYIVTEWRAKYFRNMNIKDNAYVQKATDSLLNFETVKYFNAEKHEEERYFRALQEYKVENVNVTNSMVVLNISQCFLTFVGLILNLTLAAYMIDQGRFKVGDFVLLNTYILQVYGPLFYLGSFWRWIRQAMVDVEQIFEILEVDDTIKEISNAERAVKGDGEVEFKNVSFAYDEKTDKMIIDKLSFKVEAGKSVALVGATGAGKSTIMRLLYRFYDVREGTIFVDGQDISRMKIKELRSKIGIVPQDTVLFNDTIEYNLAYGGVSDPAFKELMENENRREEFMAKLREVARKAQILNFIESKELQFDEIVGERGLKLSGGEKQRVAIARALLKHTPIMLFDEATSALDTATEKEIQGAINNASKNATTIMIAHRLSTIKGCDKIIVLKNGVIAEEGSHQELYSKGGEYRMLWDKQTQMEQWEKKEKEEEKRRAEERERVLEERASMRKKRSSMNFKNKALPHSGK